MLETVGRTGVPASDRHNLGRTRHSTGHLSEQTGEVPARIKFHGKSELWVLTEIEKAPSDQVAVVQVAWRLVEIAADGVRTAPNQEGVLQC